MNKEESEQQMKKTLATAQEQSKTKLDLMAKALDRRKDLTNQMGDRLSQSASNLPVGDRTKEFTLRAPPFAVRVGDPAVVDVSARILSSAGATPAENNQWK